MKKEDLEKYLYEDKLSYHQIVKLTGKSLTTIRYWTKKYKLYSLHSNFGDGSKPFKCKYCGTDNPKDFSDHRKSVCTSCKKEISRTYAKELYDTSGSVKAYKKNRHNKKNTLIEYKGGCCQICGYAKDKNALQFHHIDPTKKEFGIGSKLFKSLKDLKLEADKCVLLCANCHSEVHSGITTLN